MRGRLSLPINGAELEYDKLNDTLSIRDDAYKLRLTDASSGFQSAVPLFLVSHSLAREVSEQAFASARAKLADTALPYLISTTGCRHAPSATGEWRAGMACVWSRPTPPRCALGRAPVMSRAPLRPIRSHSGRHDCLNWVDWEISP